MIQQIVLGSLLLDQGIHDLVIPLLKPEYFNAKNRILMEVLLDMYSHGEPIDNITLWKKMGKRTEWSALDIAQLTNGIAHTAHVMAYVQSLKDDYVRDQLKKLADIEVPENEDPGEPLSELIKKLTELQEDQVIGAPETIVDITEKALTELLTEKSQSGMVGIPTPSGRINTETRGLRNGELIILAGRPGMGKTAFALNMVRVACESGHTVAYFSLEMKSTELVKRMIRSYRDYEAGAGMISSWKLHLFDKGGIDINFIRSNVRLLKSCQLVVIDYLGLMTVNPRIKRAEAIGEVSRALKAFALERNIPVILLSQLNRESESRQSPTHRLSDLRESGDIEQDADKVFFITRPGMLGDEKMRNTEDRSIRIQKEKDRNGQAPRFFKLKTDETFTNFYDESDQSEDTNEYQSGITRSRKDTDGPF